MIAGLQNLRRYFQLIIQSYLQSVEPDTMESFENETVETFVKNRSGTLFTYSLTAEIHILLVTKTRKGAV